MQATALLISCRHLILATGIVPLLVECLSGSVRVAAFSMGQGNMIGILNCTALVLAILITGAVLVVLWLGLCTGIRTL